MGTTAKYAPIRATCRNPRWCAEPKLVYPYTHPIGTDQAGSGKISAPIGASYEEPEVNADPIPASCEGDQGRNENNTPIHATCRYGRRIDHRHHVTQTMGQLAREHFGVRVSPLRDSLPGGR